VVAVEKVPGDVDEVIGRRKNGHTVEYECTFIGQSAKDDNKYIPLEEMVDMGSPSWLRNVTTVSLPWWLV
jgi:hypothetical protein